MSYITVGQCLTSSAQEFVVSAIYEVDGKTRYTVLGLSAPIRNELSEVSLSFYKLTERRMFSAELDERRRYVQSVINQRQASEKAEQQARYAAKVAERNDPKNAGLLTTNDEANTTNLAAKNIRLLLKKNFPGVKVSVRKRDYNCINVTWDDGPTTDAVELITDKFKEGSTDGMQDMYVFNHSAFNRVFGGVQYLFCARSLSDALIAESIVQLRQRHGVAAVPENVTVETYNTGALAGLSHEFFYFGLLSEIRSNAGKMDKSNN